MTLLDPVLVVVFLAQLGIAWRCWILARGSDSEALDGLRRRFEEDIADRARRGDGPDWVRYMDEADRVRESRVDRLRVWATGALALGIAGTMAALAYRLNQPSAPGFGILVGVAPALLASFTGVANNLFISLRLFLVSDRQFEAALDDFRQQLQDCSKENTPPGEFADAVREQLGQAFREAVRNFPEAFARLDESAKHMVEAASGLQGGVDGLAASVAKITPLSELLHAATSELRTVPDQLRQTLDQTRAAWAQEMRRDEEAFIGGVRQVLDDQRALLDRTRDAFHQWERERRESAERQQTTWRETVELMRKASEEIVGTVERLPAVFKQEVERISGTLGKDLGKEFSLGAQQHVADLQQEIREGNRALGERIEAASRDLQNRFLNDTKHVIAESAKEVNSRVGKPLLSKLQTVSDGIEEALSTLPDNAATFADSLSTADKKLGSAIDRLGESAGHLQQAAKLTQDFENALARALENATVRSFEPILREMKDLAAELRRHGPGRTDAPSTGFFPRLFRALWRRRTGSDSSR